MRSVAGEPDFVTKLYDLIGDTLAYAGTAAVGQSISHLILARDPKLPQTEEQLLTRYIAGSGIIALTLLTYAARHPKASALEAMVVHAGVLFGCGIAVGGLHLADGQRARAKAQAMDAAYEEEDRAHGAAIAPRAPLPLSISRRA